ncbi:MAG: hypothetical protein JW852_04035 [Spirochaetales bacterium]|nr:hypothetical protein [Spirochaetales bacterium]
MTLYSYILVYPEGDTQEAAAELKINQLVDLNGIPLKLPLPTVKMVVYRVSKITKYETRAEVVTRYHLELVRREEMLEYV